jgi:hypothetical protein
MSPALIILGVIICIIIYLYFFYNTRESVLTNKMDLSVAQAEIGVEKIANPASTRYAYEFWVYMGQYNGQKQELFYRDSGVNNGVCTETGTGSSKSNLFTSNAAPVYNIKVYVDSASPTMKVEYVKNNASSLTGNCSTAVQPNEKGTLVITDNFPVQTWVHIIISVDNAYIDCYMNGKLTKSVLEKDGILAPTKTAPIKFGLCQGTSLVKFKRMTSPVSPQTAWDKYSAGDGSNEFSKYLGTLGIDLSLKKDDVEYSKINLF